MNALVRIPIIQLWINLNYNIVDFAFYILRNLFTRIYFYHLEFPLAHLVSYSSFSLHKDTKLINLLGHSIYTCVSDYNNSIVQSSQIHNHKFYLGIKLHVIITQHFLLPLSPVLYSIKFRVYFGL